MIDIDTSDKREQRNFGLLMAFAIPLIGMLRFGLRWRGADEMPALPLYYFITGLLFATLALLAPRSLKPLFDSWIKLATILNFLVTHIVLSIAFFFTVVPIGILMRITGNDPLDRALDADANTYWQDAESPADDPEGYTKQY